MAMQDTALQTLLALEQRLHRLAFLLHGHDLDVNHVAAPASDASTSVASSLQGLDKLLHAVATQSSSAAELLRLQKQLPDILDEPSTASETGEISEPALAALVLAHTPSFHTTAAQLTSLVDLPVPDSLSSATLLSLSPRIQKARERQEEQAKAIAEMRQRSVALIGRWYETGIVNMGDCWNEWEGRLMDMERTVTQAEARKKREDEAV